MRLIEKLRALALSPDRATQTAGPTKWASVSGQASGRGGQANVPSFPLEKLPVELIDKIYTQLDEASLRRATLAQKSPSAEVHQALRSAWSQLAGRYSLRLSPNTGLPALALMRGLDCFLKEQQMAVDGLISRLQPKESDATNLWAENTSCLRIAKAVAKFPLAVTSLDLSRFNGADARALRAIFKPCKNLKHLILPAIIKPDNLYILERGITHCTKIESLRFLHYFDLDPDALRARLPKSLVNLRADRMAY